MALEFHTLKVSDVIKETKESITIAFEVPDELKEEYSYKHGQYLTLKIHHDGEDHRRAFSISSSPYDNEPLRITVKSINDGYISKYLNQEIEVGDEIPVMTPTGSFTVNLDEEYQRDHIMFAGGSGITPIFSILKSILKKEICSRVLLFFANRNEESIIFKDKLEELQERYSNLNVVHILSRPDETWDGLKGRLNKDFILSLIREHRPDSFEEAEYYLCGPGGMNQEVFSALEEIGTDSKKIHKESYTSPLPKEGQAEENDSDPEDIKTRKVKIILYGEEHEFEVEPDDTVLTAAMSEGHDPPFSCQIGACSTCRAKLVSGNVHMDEREALTDDEIDEGYVLTCQSHPLTNDVVIDYDEQ